MQGRSTRTWQGVAGMLVTVQMLMCAYAGSGGTVERSRSGRAGEDGSGLDSEVPSKLQRSRTSIHFLNFFRPAAADQASSKQKI